MSLGLYGLAKRALFSLDPETAHKIGMAAARLGLLGQRPVQGLETEALGITFPNPIGLAAGFDKSAVALSAWKSYGFGFVEIGTVTAKAQPGNPRPRLFRLEEEGAVINRMGFNNDGAPAIAARLEREGLGIPLGVNIGKSRATPETEAAQDYLESFKLLAPFSSYVVVNVSSPNTPGLRGLQDKEPLTRIVSGLREADPEKPLLVKVAPDLTEEAIDDIAGVVVQTGCAGVVATNTTVSRSSLKSDPGIEGGLSGAPLTSLSDSVLSAFRSKLGPSIVLIGVGGVMDAESAVRKIELGASLVQLYTGLIYRGPGLVGEVAEALLNARQEGRCPA